jgi:Fic family protein
LVSGLPLTLRETAEVIEHGITVGGKSLREYMEAVDHYDAVLWVRGMAAAENHPRIDETTVRELHRRIVARSQPEIAGIYSPHPRRIVGSRTVLPNPAKVPQLMQVFGQCLEGAGPESSVTFDAHYRLSAIHPFADGNGRTARLLMNLMLLRGGYPPVAVRPEDRRAYLDALERAPIADDQRPFQTFMHERLDATLDEYLSALQEALPSASERGGV